MTERRLIDVTPLRNRMSRCLSDICDKDPDGKNDVGSFSEMLADFIGELDNCKTVDTETLPIVKELREKLSLYENLPNEGDTLFYIRPPGLFTPMIVQFTVSEVIKNKYGWFIVFWWIGQRASIRVSQIGKTVFRTREEAENALKEGEQRC